MRKIVDILVISLLRSSLDIALSLHAFSFRLGKSMLVILIKLIFVDAKEFSFCILDMFLAVILFFVRLEMDPLI